MTNIAFTTLVFLVLAYPGYIFRNRFYAGEFTRQGLPVNWTDDVVRAVLYSIPFHVIALSTVEFFQHANVFHTTLRFEHVARLLTGHHGKDFSGFVDTFYTNKSYLLGYCGF